MKKVIKIFNIFLMGFAVAAMVLLLVMPTFKLSFNYKISMDQITEMMAKESTEGSSEETIDLKKYLGEEDVNVHFDITVSSKAVLSSFSKSAPVVVQEEFVKPNVLSVVSSIREPFSRAARAMIKAMFIAYYSTYFNTEIAAVKGPSDTRTTDEIRNAGGLTDDYLAELGERAYNKIEGSNNTLTGLTNEMYDATNEATDKFNKAGTGVTLLPLGESDKGTIRDAITTMLKPMGVVKEDGESLCPLTVVCDAYLVDTFRGMVGEIAPGGETTEEKATKIDEVLTDFIASLIPEESYNTVITALKFVFIVVFIFVATWGFYFLFTFFRTILAKKKVWTFTGPFFWIMGVVQIVLGVILTSVFAVLINKGLLASLMGEGSASALSGLSLSVYTCTFVPSILLLVLIPVTIVYGVQKRKYKKELRKELAAPKAS